MHANIWQLSFFLTSRHTLFSKFCSFPPFLPTPAEYFRERLLHLFPSPDP